ncbi:MAG: hypothetical protein DI597_00980 [Pseudoxanthomonas spadix]|nr:MAG: hypothetical protein DI597_00980 [Pseudoxanthomonas spadix]
MPRRLSCALLLALAAPLPALAGNLVDTPSLAKIDNNTGWTGNGELGLAISKGNTDNETFVGKANLAYSDDTWKHAFGVAGQYAKDDGEETARRYELFGTSGRRLSERSYIWVTGSEINTGVKPR